MEYEASTRLRRTGFAHCDDRLLVLPHTLHMQDPQGFLLLGIATHKVELAFHSELMKIAPLCPDRIGAKIARVNRWRNGTSIHIAVLHTVLRTNLYTRRLRNKCLRERAHRARAKGRGG